MHNLRLALVKILGVSLLLLLINPLLACSMYKVSANGKTILGSNHDAWMETPRIWFENEGYGACFTGSRMDGINRFAPQTGMNEFGLAFSRLAAGNAKPQGNNHGKLPIADHSQYIKDILHQCKTVEEAKAYIDKYDHSPIQETVFVYVDRSGKYLIVEPFLTYIDSSSNYVQANFYPSEIENIDEIKQERYQKGRTFLKNKSNTSIDFCRALSDTMHVCREKLGDGTLITSIWDLDEGSTYLYFYHDFEHEVKFVLKEELAKGDHMLDVTTLFPQNAEFEALKNFKTPLNSKLINAFLFGLLCFFAGSAFYFLFNFLWKMRSHKYAFAKLSIAFLSIGLTYFMFALATNINIYFYPAPYEPYQFSPLSLAIYLPYLLILLVLPSILLNFKIIKHSSWGFLSKWLFAANNLSYIVLILFFGYWGFYSVL